MHAAGPLGRHHPVEYPAATPGVGEPTRYPSTGEPGENAFDLRKPVIPRTPPRPEAPAAPKPAAELLPPPRKGPGGG